MKTVFFAASLALAGAAMPVAAIAQTADAPIVVTGKHQKDWAKGSKLEAEGLKAMEKARKDLIGASADVVAAQNKRDSAGSRAANAEREFRSLTTMVPTFASPVDAAKWAGSVDKAASAWAKYDDRGDDGRKDLAKAIKNQEKAQDAVDKAQDKIDRGRTLMAKAEAASTIALR